MLGRLENGTLKEVRVDESGRLLISGSGTTDTAGNELVSMGTKLDAVNDAVTTYPLGHSSTYISTATTTICKSGAGVLKGIVLGETAAGAITIYDNTAGSGTVLAVLKSSIAENYFEFELAFTTGLTIVTAGASKLTVIWR